MARPTMRIGLDLTSRFLDKLNFCIITFLAILEFQDATELDKALGYNEIIAILEASRIGRSSGNFNSAVKTSVIRPDPTLTFLNGIPPVVGIL